MLISALGMTDHQGHKCRMKGEGPETPWDTQHLF